MAVTLEQTHILLKEMKMAPSEQQHCLDTMRRSAIYHLTEEVVYRDWCISDSTHCHTHSYGTRIRNAEKNVGAQQYAFNALQVLTLPPAYRPPENTYKKKQQLQT